MKNFYTLTCSSYDQTRSYFDLQNDRLLKKIEPINQPHLNISEGVDIEAVLMKLVKIYV